ncbi:RHS domain-containing protein [Diaphorobacter aerolatus]|uniref:RHS domain-containing protein n=2 Tax=Diaphorobacter aerolatus TaxID=1288495 RepID=A0A7H0GGK2_9BURK|nr:RHS domain-containing protein [Diaphorobacter aerolatus]
MAEELIEHMQPGVAQTALRGMLRDIGAINTSMQGFIQRQLIEFQQMVRTQRAESAQSVEVRYYLCDHLGTPNELVNEQGYCEWASLFDAWGNVQNEYNPKHLYQPIRLAGQQVDEITNLHYNRHRYYDNFCGNYINQDPINLSGGINPFRYTANNPNSGIDPLGLACVASGNTVNCNVPGGPSISFPRPDGWPDAISSEASWHYHYYNKQVPLKGANPDCVMKGIVQSPTPGKPNAATQAAP